LLAPLAYDGDNTASSNNTTIGIGIAHIVYGSVLACDRREGEDEEHREALRFLARAPGARRPCSP